MKRLELFLILSTEESAINWCQSVGILPTASCCNICNEEMSYFPDKYFFRCNKRRCNTKISIFSGTIFERRRIPVSKILFLLYEWSSETMLSRAAYEYDLAESTVSLWYSKFRNWATYFYYLLNDEPIGGPGMVVEIDECLLVHNKYRRGRILAGQVWIFGGVVRGTDECFVEYVQRRDRETLLEVISRKIKPGSIISSDSWRAYQNLQTLLPELEITQLTVNHSQNFVNPENEEAHTQNIEAFWSVLKRKLRRHGGTTYGCNFESYFGEFLFRRKYGFIIIMKMIDCINEYLIDDSY